MNALRAVTVAVRTPVACGVVGGTSAGGGASDLTALAMAVAGVLSTQIPTRADELTVVTQVSRRAGASSGDVVARSAATGGVAVVPGAISIGGSGAALVAVDAKVAANADSAASASPTGLAVADVDVRNVQGLLTDTAAVAGVAINDGAAQIAGGTSVASQALTGSTLDRISHADSVLLSPAGHAVQSGTGVLA